MVELLSGSATGRSQSLPPNLESAAIRTEDDDVLDRNFQETPQNFFYLILLLVLIRRDNVMRHRSVCRGAQQVPVLIVIVIYHEKHPDSLSVEKCFNLRKKLIIECNIHDSILHRTYWYLTV